MASLLESIKRKSQIVVTQINTLIAAINDKLDMKTGGTVEGNLTVTGKFTVPTKGDFNSDNIETNACFIVGDINTSCLVLDSNEIMAHSPNIAEVDGRNTLFLQRDGGQVKFGANKELDEFVVNTKNSNFGGILTVSGRTIISNTTDISGATANSGALIVGSETGQHLGLDSNELMSKKDSTTPGTLSLQADGGVINCGVTTQLTTFTVNAKASSFTGTLTVPTLTVSTTLNIPGGKIWIA